MSRRESDREDLMREATALVRRAELQLPGERETVVAGYRGNHHLSIYFGSDPVLHFDECHRLRRAFVGGDLYRTQGTTLARLTRERTASVTELLRHDLTGDELAEFRARMRERLRKLLDALNAGRIAVVRSVPAEDDLLPDLRESLDRFLAAGEPLAPAIRGKS